MTDIDTSEVDGPHSGQPVRHAGADLDEATAAVVMVHGRGATAHDAGYAAKHALEDCRYDGTIVEFDHPQAATGDD